MNLLIALLFVLPAHADLVIWANDGGDKVTRTEQRASNGVAVTNSAWDGTKIKIFGAKNEVISFNLVLESPRATTQNVHVSFDRLDGPSGTTITSQAGYGDSAFNWVGRNIELFYVRYLQIKGLSGMGYDVYDERHIPKRLQRPWTGEGNGIGRWENRPDHDQFYPDIAVPYEWAQGFAIRADENQSIWSDIYIPKIAQAGTYTGIVTVTIEGKVKHLIPVELTVRGFTLPDAPSSKTMLYVGYADIRKRYLGKSYLEAKDEAQLNLIRDRHFQMAHRHKISMIDDNSGNSEWTLDQPRPEWLSRLDGSLFTAAQGYDGPGVKTGNGVYSIGTYGNWDWKNKGEKDMHRHLDAWEKWFAANSPSTERFLYLVDESSDTALTEKWASWVRSNPGIGKNILSFATTGLDNAIKNIPSLDIAASTFVVGATQAWSDALKQAQQDSRKKVYFYNGKRPASGSFATEDDGVALRELSWGQYKKKIHRWFNWESTYYLNFQKNSVENDLFNVAQTFGNKSSRHESFGELGWNYSNGDGVLFYPGTDTVYPADSYGANGPIASLRLKHWRRGIQDVDYISLAAAIDPAKTQTIVDRMVPKVLWENGISDPSDPTWVRTDISWSTNPDDWEKARTELAEIIDQVRPR